MNRLALPCSAASSIGAMYLSGRPPTGTGVHRASPDDVDARGEDAQDVGHGLGYPVVAHRAIHDAVGFVASTASRSLIATMPVTPRVRRVRPHPCRPWRPTTPRRRSVEAGIADQVVERYTTDVPRADMCDADRHCCLLKAAAGQLSNLSDATRGKQGRSWRWKSINTPLAGGFSWSARQLSSTPAGAITPLAACARGRRPGRGLRSPARRPLRLPPSGTSASGRFRQTRQRPIAFGSRPAAAPLADRPVRVLLCAVHL